MRRLLSRAILVAGCAATAAGAGCGEQERAGTASARSTAMTATTPRATTTTAVAAPAATTTAATAPARTSRGRKAARTARRFVGAPDVRVSRNGRVHVVARVDLPLPRGAYGVRGGFAIRGLHSDLPGIDDARGVRRCYEEDLWASPPRLEPGDPVTVRLHVGDRPTRTLRARTHVAGLLPVDHVSERRIQRQVLRRLGCPRLPPEEQCESVGGLTVIVRSGATCATGRRVMTQVSRWAKAGGCEQDLCASQHRMNAGFRCTVAQVGEADWAITCRRGRMVVRGGLSY